MSFTVVHEDEKRCHVYKDGVLIDTVHRCDIERVIEKNSFQFPRLATRAEVEDEECEHDDIEDFHCLDCGKDMSEDIMCRAYDMAKDRMKYGD